MIDWVIPPGTHEVRVSCARHPDVAMRRKGLYAWCPECGASVRLCLDHFGSKECVLDREHEGRHASPSGTGWVTPTPHEVGAPETGGQCKCVDWPCECACHSPAFAVMHVAMTHIEPEPLVFTLDGSDDVTREALDARAERLARCVRRA